MNHYLFNRFPIAIQMAFWYRFFFISASRKKKCFSVWINFPRYRFWFLYDFFNNRQFKNCTQIAPFPRRLLPLAHTTNVKCMNGDEIIQSIILQYKTLCTEFHFYRFFFCSLAIFQFYHANYAVPQISFYSRFLGFGFWFLVFLRGYIRTSSTCIARHKKHTAIRTQCNNP